MKKAPIFAALVCVVLTLPWQSQARETIIQVLAQCEMDLDNWAKQQPLEEFLAYKDPSALVGDRKRHFRLCMETKGAVVSKACDKLDPFGECYTLP